MAAIIIGGVDSAIAGTGALQGRSDAMLGPEMSLRNFLFRMARVLKLSNTQKNRINAILDAEMEMVKPLLDKACENKKRLIQAAEATTFDEKAVRDLAAGQARIDVELTVFRIKTQSRIHAILTPEQLEMVKFLRSEITPLSTARKSHNA
jgi:Spy/CpxP family protein refolding chaperone